MTGHVEPSYSMLELWTPEGPVHRRVSTAPPRPATLEEIPIVDLGGAQSEDAEEMAKAASAIKTAATTYGFFYIKNHGIPENVIGEAFAHAKRFFLQSQEEKMLVHSRLDSFRNGFAPVGSGQINRSETIGWLSSAPRSRMATF